MTALSTILSRRTIRFYKPLPVKEEDLRDMLNGARLTSCAANLQTLRYRVMTEPALAEKVFGTLAWAVGAIYTDPIMEYLPRFCWPQMRRDCAIVPSELRRDIGSYAGIAAALNYLEEKR